MMPLIIYSLATATQQVDRLLKRGLPFEINVSPTIQLTVTQSADWPAVHEY